MTNLPATGAVGIAPPDGARREVTQPLQSDAGGIHLADGGYVDPIQRARENERILDPLVYDQPNDPASRSVITGKTVIGLDPFYAAEKARHEAEQKSPMPAASETDTPTRGLPGTALRPAARARDPLTVTGGFGDSGEAQYFPLNGFELKALVETLLDELNDRIQNDLRFSMAICYPRASVRLQLTVTGETDDQGFMIDKVKAHDKTPLEVAQERADSVVFVITAQRREFNDVGEVESPPDAMRDELGLVKPRKQSIKMGRGSSVADLPMGF